MKKDTRSNRQKRRQIQRDNKKNARDVARRRLKSTNRRLAQENANLAKEKATTVKANKLLTREKDKYLREIQRFRGKVDKMAITEKKLSSELDNLKGIMNDENNAIAKLLNTVYGYKAHEKTLKAHLEKLTEMIREASELTNELNFFNGNYAKEDREVYSVDEYIKKS